MTAPLISMKKLEPFLLLSPALLMMVVFLGFPLVYNFGLSLFRWELGEPKRPFVGLGNFLEIFRDGSIVRVIWNSAVWTILGVGLQFASGLLLAVVTDSMRKRYSNLFQAIILLPWIVPGVITAVIWMCMLQSDLGVVNYLVTRLGLSDRNILWLADGRITIFTLIFINTWKAAPFWYLMMTAALLDVPKDQLEAADLDGAGAVARFRHVTWQHLKPVAMATLTLTSIWTFNSFDIIWTATKGGPLHASETLPIFTYLQAFTFKSYGSASAVSVLSFLIVILVCFPYIRAMSRRLKDGS